MHSRTDRQFIMLGFSFMDSGYAAKIGFGCPLGVYSLLRRYIRRSVKGARELAPFVEAGDLVCRAAHATIAAHLNISISSVKRYLTVLLKAGWVKTVPKGGRAPVYLLGERVKHGDGYQEMFYADSLTENVADSWINANEEEDGNEPEQDCETGEIPLPGRSKRATMVAQIELPGRSKRATEYRGGIERGNKEAAAAAASNSTPLPEGQKPTIDPEAVIRISRELINLDKDDTGPIDTHDVAAYLLTSLPDEELAEEAAKRLYTWHKKLTAKGTPITSLTAMARTVVKQVLAKHKAENGDSPL